MDSPLHSNMDSLLNSTVSLLRNNMGSPLHSNMDRLFHNSNMDKHHSRRQFNLNISHKRTDSLRPYLLVVRLKSMVILCLQNLYQSLRRPLRNRKSLFQIQNHLYHRPFMGCLKLPVRVDLQLTRLLVPLVW
jgi:hypothetical protein